MFSNTPSLIRTPCSATHQRWVVCKRTNTQITSLYKFIDILRTVYNIYVHFPVSCLVSFQQRSPLISLLTIISIIQTTNITLRCGACTWNSQEGEGWIQNIIYLIMTNYRLYLHLVKSYLHIHGYLNKHFIKGWHIFHKHHTPTRKRCATI